MRIDVITIFPGMIDDALSVSMMGIARDKGILDLRPHDLRDWTHDRHRTTDDSPYGGGAGLVMTPQPIFEALDDVVGDSSANTTIFFSPHGERFTQSIAEELSGLERLTLVCGRYEGFDERVYSRADRLISMGDYVVSGGEVAAIALIDSVVRLLPGVLGHDESAVDESFSQSLLEYPQYTRPASYRGMDVPEVLLSGDHARIAAWRREQSVIRTAVHRPDLLQSAILSEAEQALVERVMDDKEHER